MAGRGWRPTRALPMGLTGRFGVLPCCCVRVGLQEGGSCAEVGDLVANSPYSEVSRGSDDEDEEDDVGYPCF